MRLTRGLKKELTKQIVDHLFPKGWIEREAEEVTEYLSSDDCPEMKEIRTLLAQHPDFISKTDSYWITCRSWSRFPVNECIQLPFSYPTIKKDPNDLVRTNISFSIDDDDHYQSSYGIELPPRLRRKMEKILSKMRDQSDLAVLLDRLMDKVASDTRLKELFPELAAVIDKVVAEEGRSVVTGTDIDDINSIIGGTV